MVMSTGVAKAQVRPEIELLLSCARTQVKPESANHIRDLASQQIDWEYLLATAFSHGVMPVLYRNLSALCPGAIPHPIRNDVRNWFQSHVQRNLRLTRELLRLIRILGERGIRTLPYKGPVLAAAVYGDISLRFFSDLDILVDKSDVLQAKEIILAHGYKLRKPLTDDQEAARLRSKNEKDLAFIDLEDIVKVELHWEVASLALFPLETRRLWDRLERFNLGGTKVLNLPTEDLLLVLCVHGAKHFFCRVEWICDIGELLASTSELDWAKVLEQSKRLRIKRMLFLGLILARDMLGAVVPAEISRDLDNDVETQILAERVRGSLFREPNASLEVVKRHFHRIGLRERSSDRMRLRLYFLKDYLRALVTPNEEDSSQFRLPSTLSFLYGILRPVRLVKAYGLNLLITKGNRKRRDSST